MKKFQREAVQHDFDVDHVYTEGKYSIFAKMRKNIWHFACATSMPDVEISIGQRHIPRYSLACAVSELREMRMLNPEGFDGEMLYSSALKCLAIRKNNRFDIDLFVTTRGLPLKFGKSLYCDIGILNKAKAKIKCINGEYLLPRSKSIKGHPISSKSIRLVEAIAFERELNGRLDVKKIGIYSCYCTWRDFCFDTPFPLKNVQKIIAVQLKIDAELIDDEKLMALAMQVQRNYFSSPIWGKGISVEKESAVRILGETLSRLSSVQIAQFHMLNELHGTDLFATFAAVTGMLSLKAYMDLKTMHIRPDSREKQRFRTEIAYLQLFDELASERSEN